MYRTDKDELSVKIYKSSSRNIRQSLLGIRSCRTTMRVSTIYWIIHLGMDSPIIK